MLLDSRWLVLLLLWGLLWLAWTGRHRTCAPSENTAVTACVQRLLKPRTPDDCPACWRQSALPVANTPPPSAVTPWREVKCRRGAPKRINTHGFSCPNHACPYYRISDAQVHALVGQGSHRRCERIQTLQCQSCHSTFSTRRATPLYRLKTSSQRVAMVLTALAEGLDVSAAVRVFGHRHATITTWLMPAGAHSTTLHDHGFRNLHLPHLHLDELRTHLRHRAHVLWLWVVVDPLTKIIAVLHHPEVPGARTQDAAHTVIHDLYGRLIPGGLPVLRSDGLNVYFYALTAHFGQWVTGVGRRARQWLLRGGATVWAGEEELSAAEVGARHAGDALWHTRRVEERIADCGLEWTAE